MGNDLQIHRLSVGRLEVNCYILFDRTTSKALIADPGDEYERIRDVIDGHGLKPESIVFTHAHYDHVCAAGEIKDRYKALIIMHEDELDIYAGTKKLCVSWGYEPEDFPPPDVLVKDGDTVKAGQFLFRIIHTPGHSPGSICLYGENTLLTGDTLFAGSAGRTDLRGGSYGHLVRSLRKIASLPGETRLLCGHGDETTIERELKTNPFITGL